MARGRGRVSQWRQSLLGSGSTFTSFVLAMGLLYLAREVLIPVALAVLLTFLLSPVVLMLQRRGLGRAPAVVAVVVGVLGLVASLAVVVGGQLLDLADQLPHYKANILAKANEIRGSSPSSLAKASDTLAELTDELAQDPPGTKVVAKSASGTLGTPQRPLFVEMVDNSTAFELMRSLVGPVLSPMATLAMVLVFVIFMLIEREDLRDRFLRLLGREQLTMSTQALDDAAQRVSRYLITQSMINTGFGVAIACGLLLIGLPNALLWGFLAAVLRYIPYLGPWLAAVMPITLSVAVSDGWRDPLLTVSLFGVCELITNNVLEPWLYGSGVGLSPVAVLVTAVFWTWMWGGIGLILATPLTVCMVVMSRYVPRLEFLAIMLGDEPPLGDDARLYQRLLARDLQEATTILERAYAQHGKVGVLDRVIFPALRIAVSDHRRGRLDAERTEWVCRQLPVLYDALEAAPGALGPVVGSLHVLCLPGRDFADEIAGELLARALHGGPVRCEVLSIEMTAGEQLEQVASKQPQAIVVSTLAPFSTQYARYLHKRLQARFTDLRVVVGLWGSRPGARSYRALESTGAHRIATTPGQALALLARWLPVDDLTSTP